MAIAFDFSSSGNNSGGATATITISHTCSGSDRILFVAIAPGSRTINSVTYNGDALTEIDFVSFGPLNAAMYYMVAPDSGAHDIVVTLSASGAPATAAAASYTGASQTDQPDSFGTDGGIESAEWSTATTVIESSCWLAGAFAVLTNGQSEGTGTTFRENLIDGDYRIAIADSDGTVGTGSQALASIPSTISWVAGIVASFAPSAGSDTFTASGAATAGAATASGTATFSPGTKTAAGAATAGASTASGTATFTKPVYAATGAATAGAATAAGSATFAPGTKTAAGTATAGAATASGSAQFTKPVYSAIGSATAGAATAAGSATFTKPVFTAASASTVGAATASGSALFGASVSVGVVSATTGAATASGSATFVAPVAAPVSGTGSTPMKIPRSNYAAYVRAQAELDRKLEKAIKKAKKEREIELVMRAIADGMFD